MKTKYSQEHIDKACALFRRALEITSTTDTAIYIDFGGHVSRLSIFTIDKEMRIDHSQSLSTFLDGLSIESENEKINPFFKEANELLDKFEK
ncbi:hypothetical protein [Vibrio panuliri]|uniref:Uncharacterized protein n=1 Tax=Vibrio panuliri TaxID=1381081 RepID=A0ABX3FJ86_9VIBR|nr:hypothetical protein [Vibrio panuliri]KAB1457394.1 hypothetical protein F7O85_06535 [Vibrio panuliri]OLQ91444.1 hypothetical protein BIY20_01145 [Vibrio panuliri]